MSGVMETAPVKDFLEGWRRKYVEGLKGVSMTYLDALMYDLISDARKRGYSRQDLDNAAGGNLRGYITQALQHSAEGHS
jgi:hypothetical protein